MYWKVPPRQHVGEPCHPSTPRDALMRTDFAADALRLGGDYPCLGPNLNLPFFMALIQPLGKLPFTQAWITWTLLSILGGLLGVALVVKTIGGDHPFSSWLLGSSFLFIYYPTLSNFALGQVTLLLLPILTLAWHDLRRGREYSAGLWLGLLIGLKPFFAILLPALLIQRRWIAILSASASGLVTLLIGYAFFGAEAYSHYAILAADVTWSGANWNGSWAGVIERIISGQQSSTLPQGSHIARSWTAVISIATLVLMLILLWLHREKHKSLKLQSDALIAAGIPTALLVSPLGWSYYFPLLMIPVVIAWGMTKFQYFGRKWKLLLILPIALSMTPTTLRPSPRPESPSLWWGVDSIYFYSLALLLILCLTLKIKCTEIED